MAPRTRWAAHAATAAAMASAAACAKRHPVGSGSLPQPTSVVPGGPATGPSTGLPAGPGTAQPRDRSAGSRDASPAAAAGAPARGQHRHAIPAPSGLRRPAPRAPGAPGGVLRAPIVLPPPLAAGVGTVRSLAASPGACEAPASAARTATTESRAPLSAAAPRAPETHVPTSTRPLTASTRVDAGRPRNAPFRIRTTRTCSTFLLEEMYP